uniref:Uncharacterized protein n=1 Tax=Rheinheimera sp. BAL341 TaxID=1708203 RepID=A0A486XK29_9GAMM
MTANARYFLKGGAGAVSAVSKGQQEIKRRRRIFCLLSHLVGHAAVVGI